MEEINIFSEIMKNQTIGSTLITASLTSMISIAIAGLVSRNKRINNSVSKKDLKDGIMEAKNYTDDKLSAHEKNQIIEIDNLKTKVEDTHKMVTFLYQNAITKRR